MTRVKIRTCKSGERFLILISNTTIRIGTRGSRLALAQAEWVKVRIEAAHTHVRVELEIIKTTGDIMKSAPLTVIGGQGVFTKELEAALLARRINLAVHSLKDLPSQEHEGLALAATPAREDARDALVMPAHGETGKINSLLDLPSNAVVGTSSLRRLSQLKHLRPDLRVTELRGNVDTRLRKLDAGEYDAIILAAAGLRRLGLESRITVALNTAEMLPAVGQAALGLEIRDDDEGTREIVRALNDSDTFAACIAERSLLKHLGGGCQFPIAGFAEMSVDGLRLRGLVAEPNGETVLRDELIGDASAPERLGQRLADVLLHRGAEQMLFAARP